MKGKAAIAAIGKSFERSSQSLQARPHAHLCGSRPRSSAIAWFRARRPSTAQPRIRLRTTARLCSLRTATRPENQAREGSLWRQAVIDLHLAAVRDCRAERSLELVGLTKQARHPIWAFCIISFVGVNVPYVQLILNFLVKSK